MQQTTGNDSAAGMKSVLNHIQSKHTDYKLTLPISTLKYTVCKTDNVCKGSGFISCSPNL